jgi:intracellular septation protein
MQLLLNFLPLLAFAVAYRIGGIYAATATLMACMPLLLLVDWVRTRRVSGMHALSTVLVLVFGSVTLLLHDPRFLMAKPSILLGVMALVFLSSERLGTEPLAQRLLEQAVPEGTTLARSAWLRFNREWVAALVLLAAANLVVAHYASERAWVYFKVVGLTLAPVLVTVAQALRLPRLARPASREEKIRAALRSRFHPTALEVHDDSAAHSGHAGHGGKGHFRVLVVSDAFTGKTLVQRHRLVHDALAPLFDSDIHALSITARAKDD